MFFYCVQYKSRHEGDLVAKCYFAKHKLVWEVLDGGLKNKIEIQWSDILALKATYADDEPGTLDIVVIFISLMQLLYENPYSLLLSGLQLIGHCYHFRYAMFSLLIYSVVAAIKAASFLQRDKSTT